MNLKESYRYANYLDNLLRAAYAYLRNRDFVTTTKQKHLRSKTNSEAHDETLEIKKPFDVDFNPNDVIDFIIKVIDEKDRLSDAIADAKSKTEINIDNAIAMNKKKQGFVSVLNNIVDIKPDTSTIQGYGYKFNQEGDQVKYFYDVEQETSIDFDRNNIRKLIKKYLKETDDVSAKLDAIEINTFLDFIPVFDVNDHFEDIVVA